MKTPGDQLGKGAKGMGAATEASTAHVLGKALASPQRKPAM